MHRMTMENESYLIVSIRVINDMPPCHRHRFLSFSTHLCPGRSLFIYVTASSAAALPARHQSGIFGSMTFVVLAFLWGGRSTMTTNNEWPDEDNGQQVLVLSLLLLES